jgi:outer membrane protein assembly factor BamD
LKNRLLTKIARNSRSRSARALGSGAVLTIALLCGCATAPPEEEELPSAESYYQHGVETLAGKRTFLLFHDVDYAKAIEYFQEVIDNYPYSDFAILAELQIADIHFERGEYEEASSYYHDFVELHPNHPKVAYALYRNGLCSYNQMRAADRDQASTREAAAQFRALLERFPTSDMVADARIRLAECEDRLALQILDIADFYYAQDDFHSAARRYEQAITTYPGHSTRARTMTRLGVCLARLHQVERAKEVLQSALKLEPTEDLRDTAQAALDGLTTVQQ